MSSTRPGSEKKMTGDEDEKEREKDTYDDGDEEEAEYN